jgi:hypothetical protein
MALSGYSRRRRRGRFGLAIAKWGTVVVVVLVAAALLYDLGRRHGAVEVTRLAQQVEALKGDGETLAAANRQLTATLADQQQRFAELKQAYEKDVPKGPIRELNTLIGERMTAGVSAAELRAAVAAVEPATDCASALEHKRLRVAIDQSPLQDGVGSFGQGALTIRVTGEAAHDTQGQPEAWFDEDKPVTVLLVRPGGRNDRWSGSLPLHPTVRLADNEYRFTIAADVRGLVEVAMQRCRAD